MKKCYRCSEIKPKSEFARCKTKKDGLQSNCKCCRKEWYQNNKEKIQNTQYLYKFGITSKEYNAKLLKQNFCCAICNKYYTQNKRRLVVDHCHTTNIVRDLLCDNCNVLLGHAKDNIEILKKAISYLKEHNE